MTKSRARKAKNAAQNVASYRRDPRLTGFARVRLGWMEAGRKEKEILMYQNYERTSDVSWGEIRFPYHFLKDHSEKRNNKVSKLDHIQSTGGT